MRFTIARLCGGKALMATPREDIVIDLEKAKEILSSEGTIKQKDELLLTMDWKNMETTIYEQGKIMFYPLEDRILCVEYATYILEKIC